MTETFRMRMNKNKKKFGLKMVMRHTQRDITTVLFRLYTAGLSLSLLWSIQLVIRWISNQRTRLAAFSFFFFHMNFNALGHLPKKGSLRKFRDGRGIGRGPFYGEHLLD